MVLIGDAVGEVGNVGDVHDVGNCVIVPAVAALEVEAKTVDDESVAENTLGEDEALFIRDSRVYIRQSIFKGENRVLDSNRTGFQSHTKTSKSIWWYFGRVTLNHSCHGMCSQRRRK